MLCNIIALGDSASKWDGSGDSIGVNDAAKWGHPIQKLVLLNSPDEFEPDRLDIIKNTKAEKIYTCYREWQRPQYKMDNIQFFNYNVWQGQLLTKGRFQVSRTSPFCAISVAYGLGYDEIVLWGVDFKTHKIWHHGNHNFAQEINNYQDIAARLKEKGVRVYSCEPSVLKLPIYPKYDLDNGILLIDGKQYIHTKENPNLRLVND